MKVKRFLAKDVRSALQNVRETLGPDAMILSNRSVKEGVEIICGLDAENDSTDGNNNKKPNSTTQISQVSDNWLEDPAIKAMRTELKSLRGLLEHQLCDLAWHDLQQRKPIEAAIIRRLLGLGFHANLARDIAVSATKIMPKNADIEQVWYEALDKMASLIPVVNHDNITPNRVVALVGPTGVGKTTTVAKLAARYVLKHGAKGLGLISMDSKRVAGSDALRAYARIFNVPMRIVDNQNDLMKTLSAFCDKQCILIDTPGKGQWDKTLPEQLKIFEGINVPITTYLCLSLTAQHALLDLIIKTFAWANLAGCIFTKLDEAVCLGGALDVVIQHHLPIAYVTDGQCVPQDLKIALSHQLMSRAVQVVGRVHDNNISEEELALQLGGAMVDAR